MLPDATELMKLIKKSALEAMEAADPMHFLFGKVIGVEPLLIDVEQKMKLGKAQLVLSRNVTDFETEVSVDVETDKASNSHLHDMQIQMEEAGEVPHIHNIAYNMGPVDLAHTHMIKKRMKVTIHNGLAVGDEVILLRNKGGQKYMVVDRIG